MTHPKLSASDLKRLHEINQPDSYFFDSKSMRFFGDKMSNYYVPVGLVEVEAWSGTYTCYELQRRKPVKHGLQSSAFFDCETFQRVLPKEG